MRKITIPVSAVLALSAIPMAQAATFTVDFSKVTDHAVDPSGKNNPGPLEVEGFTFAGGGKSGFNLKNGVGASYTIGGRTMDEGRTIYFTPKKSGRLTYNLTCTKDKNPEYYNAVTTEVADYFKNGKPTDDVLKSFIAFNTLGKKANGTFSVDLVGGQTYYIVVSEQHIVYSISYVEEAGPTKDVEVTVKKDKTEGTGSIVLNKGTYTLSAANGDLTVKIGNAVVAKDAPVIITENNTTVDLSVKLGDKATADTKVAVTAEISDVSLDLVKSVYTQKIAVMINKANVYTNDTRLQECAVQASSLMAEANGMGITQYDEYITTGKIATLDKKIADLSTKIDNAKAAYDGYVYAQGKYGNKYENGWVVDESNTTSLLAKKKELDEAYANATKNIKEEAALAALKTVYNNAVKALEDFKATIDAEYAEGKQTDYAAYTSSIDTRVGSVKTDKVEASGVMGTLDEARKAIVNGDGNAISYANVNTAVNSAMASYTTEADNLYALLANNTTEKDGETYRDMYLEALGKLNNYLRVINEVKAENEEKYQAKECTKETQEAFIAKLAEVDNIGSVYTEYYTRATTLRTNYKNACSDINNNLTGYLTSQVKDVIGKKGGKDYTRKEVSEFYASQISAIETSITSIQTNVNNVNKEHIIGNGTDTPYYADYVTEKDAVVAAIDALNLKVAASVREFDNWESSKSVVAGLQAEFKLRKEGNKNDVKGVINTVSKDKVYSQATKFSAEYERTIQERINALLAAANASFAVEVKDGKTPAADFYKIIADNQEDKDGKVTLYGSAAIAKNIEDYAKAAADAMTKYETVVAALASYNDALNGVGKEGDKDYEKGLKDVVTETGVTIDGTFEGKTYGAYIAEVEEKIGATKGLQKQLNDAVALNDTQHVKAMTDLTTFDDLVAEINSLKDSYPANAEAWNKVQLAHAKTSMLAEATRRVGVIDTKNVIKNDVYTDEYKTVVDEKQTNSNVTSFEEDTYGMWINDQTVKENDKDVKKEGLATLLKKCNDAVKAIQDKITSAEKSTDDAAAIAILSTVVTELEGAEAQYQSLSTLAEKVKTAYSAEKAARKELLVAIDGKDGLIDKLAKVTFTKNGAEMFTKEKTDQSTAITKLKDDIKDNFAAETVVANKQKLVDAKGKIDTAVKNLNDLVAKEQANKDANDAYTTAETTINIAKAFTDAEAAIAQAVTDKKAVAGSGAYNYYVNTVLAGYRTENTTIATNRNTANTAVRKVYEKDGKTVLSGALDEAKYTDPAKNMTTKGDGIKSDLDTLKTNVGKVAEKLIACEAAYSTQTTKADDLDKLRAEVFNTITSAETSSYHDEALAKLQDIDKEIADYKDAVGDAYKIGTNDTGKADIEAKANSAETKLTTLKTGWNDAYSKAVAGDNEARKLEFDKAYTSLTQTYAQDVDLIARLSKLSYADEFGDDLKVVVGDKGIYSYADKIRDLKTRTETAYSAVVAPTLFDGGEAFKAEAKALEAEIKKITTDYTKKVNEAAEDKYDEESAKVTKSLSDAKTEVQTVLGAAFVTTDFLTEQFQDVQNIIDEAKGYTKKDEAGNFIKADFAEYLDNTILPSFATVDSKIAADKLAAAKTVYTNVLTEYRTLANSEATLIAGYHVNGKLGSYSDDYKAFIEGSLDKAEELWAKIADADKYAKFDQDLAEDEPKSVKAALSAFGTPDVHDGYVKDAKDQPAEWAVKHTEDFWKAFDADQEYHANDIAYGSMQTKIGDVQAELDKANEFVASLIIRNNSTILNRLSIAQGAIKNLKDDADRYHTANTAEANLAGFRTNCDAEIAIIKSIIEGKTTGAALVEENTAVEVQIGFLQHDYNQAAAVNIDNEKFDTEHYKSLIAGYSKKNADILRDFKSGKVDDKGLPILDEKKNVVYATAEETRQAFIALETEVGKMKSELTALYNEAAAAEAQAAVQAKIDELTATYDEFVAQLADCHAPVKEEYQPAVDAFKADIDALQAVLNAEAAANTVLLYQDENVKTASAIANSVATLSGNIAGAEEPYDVNDAKYLELRGQLNTLTERLESVHNAIKEYENKQEDTKGDTYYYDLNGDEVYSDDEKFTTYYEQRYAIVASYIAKDMEWLNGENEKYRLTSTSILPSNSKETTIADEISTTEKICAKYNADMTIDALKNALAAANDDIEEGGYTDADRQNLEATYAELNSKVESLGTYNTDAYLNHVNSDIEGKPIKNEEGTVVGKDVVYMDEYPAIMEAAKALKADVATLAEDAVNKSWIKGDVDHNGKITVADYDAVRQMVLELIEYTKTDAMFYAADVNWDGLVNIGDVTMIGSNIMEGKEFPKGPAGTSSVAMAKGMAAGMPTYGNLALTAEGSGLAQTLRVAVDSRLGFVGGQFDVVLPKGVKLVSVASSSHDALMGEVDGAFRVLVSNLENTEIVNGQAFVELNVEVTSDYDGGGIEVRNVKFADADGTVFNLAKSSISTPTSLTNLTTTEKIQSKVYTVGGMLMNKVKKGINIIVNSDGTTKKQVIE